MLDLSFYGASARLTADSDGVLEPLRRDFEHFLAPPAGDRPALSWSLSRRAPPQPQGRALFSTGAFSVFQRGTLRHIRYRERACAVFDYASGRGQVVCEDPALLHELTYLAVLSRVGERLEEEGLHRVHALGFSWGGQGGLLVLPSGGGKSTLALELLKRPDFRLLSDDTPLLDRGGTRLRAFPLRLGFRADADLAEVPGRFLRPFLRRRHGPKRVVDLGFFRHALAEEAPLRWLLIGAPGGAGPRVAPLAKPLAWPALALSLVVGHGVAQMAEYMVDPSLGGAARLARLGLARLACARSALNAAQCASFTLGTDPAAAAGLLEAHLRRSRADLLESSTWPTS